MQEAISGLMRGKAEAVEVVLHFQQMQMELLMKTVHVFTETLAGTLQEDVMVGIFPAEDQTEASVEMESDPRGTKVAVTGSSAAAAVVVGRPQGESMVRAVSGGHLLGLRGSTFGTVPRT